MIVVFAGRRIDTDAADTPRFPLACVERVEREIDRFLHERRPAVIVGSAACGADLLVLEAAGRLSIRRRVVLPFDRDTFRTLSVADRPGDWGPRFDRVIEAVVRRGDLIEYRHDPGDPAAYLHANAAIFRDAEALASGSSQALAALVLWEGGTRGQGDVTQAFLDEATRRGWPTSEIDTGAATVPVGSAREG